MQHGIRLACFPNSKLLILEDFSNYYASKILCLDGNFNSCFSCRILHIIWMIPNQCEIEVEIPIRLDMKTRSMIESVDLWFLELIQI